MDRKRIIGEVAARHGVRVSVVCPGIVDTPILSQGAVGRFRGRAYYDDLARSRPAYPLCSRGMAHFPSCVTLRAGVFSVSRTTRHRWPMQSRVSSMILSGHGRSGSADARR